MSEQQQQFTCQYLSIQDTYCGHIHTDKQSAEKCAVRKSSEQWKTQEVDSGFYARRWGKDRKAK